VLVECRIKGADWCEEGPLNRFHFWITLRISYIWEL
jgi:hypothetical protein